MHSPRLKHQRQARAGGCERAAPRWLVGRVRAGGARWLVVTWSRWFGWRWLLHRSLIVVTRCESDDLGAGI